MDAVAIAEQGAMRRLEAARALRQNILDGLPAMKSGWALMEAIEAARLADVAVLVAAGELARYREYPGEWEESAEGGV